MPIATLFSGNYGVREIFETDRTGNIIPPEKSTRHVIYFVPMLRCKDFEISFPVKASVSLAKIEHESNRTDATCSMALAELARRMSRGFCPYPFSTTESDLDLSRLDEPRGTNGASENVRERSFEIPERVVEQLAPHAREVRLARSAFEKAVERLKSSADSPEPSAYQDQIRSDLYLIDECLRCGYLGFLYAWYNEKQATLHSSFEDIIRRRRKTHEGYLRSQLSIKGILHQYEAPLAWVEIPPVVREADEL